MALELATPIEACLDPSKEVWDVIDKRDLNTPDDWIPRHPDLVRLTGRHPFNCEAPLTSLYEAGFLTPAPLHYVRNHGAVPKMDAETHVVKMHGTVGCPGSVTMVEIRAMPKRVIPVTMVCAGNRRKEENMIKQTKGFNWGAAGVSTAVWGGVRLCDLLLHFGVQLPKDGRRMYVHFVGADTLPNGKTNDYGTSIPLGEAMNPANDVLIAYEMNGQELSPDHGYPVRTIIPGHIGGRTIKWLTEIWVSAEESENYYHYFDNRVLPSGVDAELADKEGWWFKPDYIIMELNINSAAAYPAHNEIFETSLRETYTCKGYAYSGGGRKVIRVEVTTDGGASWHLARIIHLERPTEYNKHWCWAFWEAEIAVAELAGSKEIAVRAWDSSMNTQPENPSWNVMGMMNNAWFRVKVHNFQSPTGANLLTFEHPTQPANIPGGWMAREKEEQAVAAVLPSLPKAEPAPVVAAAPPTVQADIATKKGNMYTVEEVARHSTEEDVWIIVSGKVYDCTPFLKAHPGGADSIMLSAGQDATDEFGAIHSSKAWKMLEDYYIGDVGEGVKPAISIPIREVPASSRPIALSKEKISCPLIVKENLSHDVVRLRFALPTEEHILGLPVGKHVFLVAQVDSALCMRAYTPTSSDNDKGFIELVVKVYNRNVHPKFPDGGKMSQHLNSLAIGETIQIKGPVGHCHYLGCGRFNVDKKEFSVKRMSMIAGGTGITPMLQVIREILRNPLDTTEVSLLYANQTPEDILLRGELDELSAQHPSFKVWYTVDRAPERWAYSQGFVDEAMVRDRLFPAGEDCIALLCGPPPMVKFACIPNLEKAGYKEERIVSF